MVVRYDEDGKAAGRVGNAFVEKGVENTYVVAGGFLGLCAACPEAMVGETPAEEELVRMMASAGLKPPGSAPSPGGMSSRCSTAGSVRTQRTGLTSSRLGR
jgi:centrosomal protein CEP41